MARAPSTICAGTLIWASFCFSAMAADSRPVEIRVEPGTVVQIETEPPAVSLAQKRSHARDARHCLSLPTYTAIIKCAEKYL